jgi:hypothetical protein
MHTNRSTKRKRMLASVVRTRVALRMKTLFGSSLRDLGTAAGLIDTLLGSRIVDELGQRTRRPRDQIAAAIGTFSLQNVTRAGFAERTFE